MLAAHPDFWVYVANGAALVGLIGAAVALLEKAFSPFGKWVRRWVTEPIATEQRALSDQLGRHETYVGYHLGPNGTTTPIHTRVARLEQAAGIEDDDEDF